MVLGTRGLSQERQVLHVLLGQRASVRSHGLVTTRPLQAGGRLHDGAADRQREMHRLQRLLRRQRTGLLFLRTLHRRQLHLDVPARRRPRHPRRGHPAQVHQRQPVVGEPAGTCHRGTFHLEEQQHLL